MKMILIVRDPVERIIAHHSARQYEAMINNTFTEKTFPSLDDILLDENEELITSHPYINISTYHYHLENWLQWFPLEQFFIFNYKQFLATPLQILLKLEAFLGLRNELANDMFDFTKKRDMYCYKVNGEEKCMWFIKDQFSVNNMSDTLKTQLHEHFKPLTKRFHVLSGVTII